MKHLLLYSALLVSASLFAQKSNEHCCTIIDMAKEAGTFTIRDSHTGRIQLFKPDALEGAELKVGDSVDAAFDTKRITSVKGISRSYDMLAASSGDSCCNILKLDSVMNEPFWRITAKNNTSGENIHFNVPKMLAAKLNAGGFVFTQPSHGYAMITSAQTDSTEKFLYGFPMLQENK